MRVTVSATGALRRRRGWCVPFLALAGLVLTACPYNSQSPHPVNLSAVQVVDGEELRYWTGDECTNVTAVEVRLTKDREDRLETTDSWLIEAEQQDGNSLGDLTVGVTPDGFTELDALEESWTDADTVLFDFYEGEGATVGGTADVEMLDEEAADHAGEWYVDGVADVDGLDPDGGWYTEEEFSDMLDPGEDVHSSCP